MSRFIRNTSPAGDRQAIGSVSWPLEPPGWPVAVRHFDRPEAVLNPEKCKACLICLNKCPAQAIDGAKRTIHIIDQEICNGCGVCFEVCFEVCPSRFTAVERISGEPVPPPLPDEQRTIVRKRKGQ